jgi:hypothetical protein
MEETTKKIESFDGTNLYGNLSFNLYPFEGIEFEESSKALLEGFKFEFETDIMEELKKAGINLEGFYFHSPKYYNYQGDSIDIKASIDDKNKLIDYIKNNTEDIEQRLKDNVSYDGYISLTEDNIEEVLGEVEADKIPIILIVSILSKIDFTLFDPFDYIIWEEEEDN